MIAPLLVAVVSAIDFQGWIYPGPPDCNITAGLNNFSITTLKPQYMLLHQNGLELMTEANWGCNGYSPSNAALIKAKSKYQYFTVSSSNLLLMRQVWTTPAQRATLVTNITTVVNKVNFTGVEIDWEKYSKWNQTDYTNYKLFITALGNALHKYNRKLIVVAPLIVPTFQHYYAFNYSDFNSLPVDYLAVMAYDYQWDYGCGTPRSPISWVQEGVQYLQSKILHWDKIIVGLPGDCYSCVPNSWQMQYAPFYQTFLDSNGASAAYRDKDSLELFWTNNNMFYSCPDSVTLANRRNITAALNISHISIWYLG
ncbi:hypothetical protein HDV06_006937, partial [Boothiomyces sp. JEL0866]